MKPIHTLFVAALISMGFVAPSRCQTIDTDLIGNAWLQRSQAATKKLTKPGLDACDRALENAFSHPEEVATKSVRTFKINIEVAGQTMHAAYAYKDHKLDAFQLIDLPTGWIIWQRSKNKTLTVFVSAANCAMDLCTNNPFAPGLCEGENLE